MKIQIIGYSGSGKSTLAVALHEITGIPVLHMDSARFYGDWQERTDEQQACMVADFMAANDSWIIDGNYLSVALERFSASDITIFLDFGRWQCFFAAYRRFRKFRGTSRPDLPCPEKFDRSFRRWLLIDGRTRARRQKLLSRFNATGGRKIVLKNRRQLRAFLQEFSQSFNKGESN